jgi:hypothetical protein
MVFLDVTHTDMFVLGQALVGFPLIRQSVTHETQMRRFMAHFGTCPVTCAAIFADLQTTPNATARLAKPDITYFFMALHWLKTYGTEAQIAGTFKFDEKTVRNSVKKYVNAAKAVSDSTDLAKDRRTRPPPKHTSKGYPRWDGSDAARFLKEDADKGLLQQLKPSELRETRQEYKLFPAKVFRDHIHQEKRGRTSKSYWMVRKQQQQQAKK